MTKNRWTSFMVFQFSRKIRVEILLKVSKFRNVSLVSSILPKDELEKFNFCPSLLGQKYFVRFLEEFKTPKVLFKLTDL